MRKIPDEIIERGAELWARALRRPKFDNGDRSFVGAVGMGLASGLADLKASEVDDLDGKIDAFKSALVERLKFDRDHEGQETGKPGTYAPETYWFETFLSTDYHPCRVLAEVAETVGIPTQLFSIKSSVSLHHDSAGSAFGYGVEDTFHYPLGDGRWLLTTLRGGDMPTIIDAVKAGRLPELTVEG